MARNKQNKIKEVGSFHNVFELKDSISIENEIEKYFGNQNPITIELGCGRADYSINLASNYPDRNFIGLDVKGERIWNGSQKADELKLKNVAFIIGDISNLKSHFPNKKIDEFWIPFPDPHPKKKSINKRLISPFFLNIYKEVINIDGNINFKTDDNGLYNYANEVLNDLQIEPIINIQDISKETELPFELRIRTKYEEMHIKNGKTIKYISFRL